MPTLAPMHSKNVPLGHVDPLVDASRGSAVSALLTQSSANINTTLLIPKTEKLSPVQLYGTDRNSLTGMGKLVWMHLFKLLYVISLWSPVGLTRLQNNLFISDLNPVWLLKCKGGRLWNAHVICSNISRLNLQQNNKQQMRNYVWIFLVLIQKIQG